MSFQSRLLEEFLGGKEKMGEVRYACDTRAEVAPPPVVPHHPAVPQLVDIATPDEVLRLTRFAQRRLEEFLGGREKMGQIRFARGACPKVLPSEDEEPVTMMTLPNEMLTHIFSLLPIQDRLRARVNRRLRAIEASSKYSVSKLVVREQSMHAPLPASWNIRSPGEQRILLRRERWYWPDFMDKIAENAHVAHLSITLAGTDILHVEAAGKIKNFNVGMLNIDLQSPRLSSLLPMTAFLTDLTHTCKLLMLNQCENIGGKDLVAVYQMMESGAAKLRMFWLQLRRVSCTVFLHHIGIVHRDGGYRCKRAIEAYELVYYYELDDEIHQRRITYVFDGMMEITMYDEIFYGAEKGRFELKLHESAESIAEAKNRADLVAVDVILELY